MSSVWLLSYQSHVAPVARGQNSPLVSPVRPLVGARVVNESEMDIMLTLSERLIRGKKVVEALVAFGPPRTSDDDYECCERARGFVNEHDATCPLKMAEEWLKEFP